MKTIAAKQKIKEKYVRGDKRINEVFLRGQKMNAGGQDT